MNVISDVEPRYRPFRCKYHGPGNVRGSRIGITDLRNGVRVSIEYDDAKGRTHQQAGEYLESLGITVDGLACADTECGPLLLSLNFSTPLKGGDK